MNDNTDAGEAQEFEGRLHEPLGWRMQTTQRTCRRCNSPVTKTRPGRSPEYCSVACRREQEYELRRVQRALAEAEESLKLRRYDLDHPTAWGPKRDYATHEVRVWSAQVDALTRRLAQLLGTSS